MSAGINIAEYIHTISASTEPPVLTVANTAVLHMGAPVQAVSITADGMWQRWEYPIAPGLPQVKDGQVCSRHVPGSAALTEMTPRHVSLRGSSSLLQAGLMASNATGDS